MSKCISREGEYSAAADELEARTGGPHVDAKHWGEVGRLRARIRELEAENRQLLIVGRPDRKANRRYGAVLRERDALAAQIEAALRLLAVGVRADPDRVAGILSAGSEVRARILAEHDARVLEEAADEFAVVPHPYEGGVTGWLRARAAEKREEADRG